MTKKIGTILFVCALILASIPVSGYNLRQITNRDNLSNSSIVSMCQDIRGLMWIGTCDGLNMYNGRYVSIYQPESIDKELSGNLIDCVMEAEEDVIWVSTYFGLDRIERKTGKVEHFGRFKKRTLLAKDNSNNFYIIQDNNDIFYYSGKKGDFCKIQLNNSVSGKILDFFIDTSNTMWIFTTDGSRFNYQISEDPQGDIILLRKPGTQHPYDILYCFNDGSNIFFIDEKYDLYEVNPFIETTSYISNLGKQILKNGEVSSVLKYKNDYFVGFKANGLIVLRNTGEKYTIENMPFNCGVFCMAKDRYQDIVWIGTDGQGIYTYSDESYSISSTILSDLGLRVGKPVRALYLDDENTMWIGTKGDGIVKIYDYDIHKSIFDYKVEVVNADNSLLKDNSVFSFAGSKKDILWVGNEYGLNYYSYRDKTLKNVELTDEGVPIHYIHDIYEQDSILWLSSVGMGAIKARIIWQGDRPELKVVKRMVLNNRDVPSDYFFSLYPESDSIIWFANRGAGAFRVQTKTMEFSQIEFNGENDNKTLNEVFSIKSDALGNHLFGTSFGLVKNSPDGSYRVFNKSNGFSNNTIHSILQEADNVFWLSTNRGIINYNSENDIFRVYEYRDNLSIVEFSDGASFKDDRNGVLYFGGINGFVSIKNNNIETREYMPPVYFDDLSIFGKIYNLHEFLSEKDGNETLVLKYDQTFFSISFTAIDYLNGNNYVYSYKLRGINDQWVDKGNSNVLSFTDLAPGEYTLLVKYYNKATEKESAEYMFNIKILPPWYKSAIAYIIYILLFVAAVYLLIRRIIFLGKKKKENLLSKIEQQHKEEIYESKLRFFTNVAHEFCTPLTLIYGPCSRILSHKNLDRSVMKYTKVIQQNAERLNALIQDLIEFRRIETNHKNPQIEQLHISEIINRVTDSFIVLAESCQLHFEKNISSSLHWNSDADFIITIITNLISNAFKYTAENGSIKINASIAGDSLCITVSNTGKGIKEENIPKIFDRYTILDNFENSDNSDNRWSRNGLGLAISYGLVSLLRGKIEVESTLSEWTHFKVILPAMEIDTERVSLNSEVYGIRENTQEVNVELHFPEYEINSAKPVMLIIDDERDILWLISDIFSDEYNIIPVNNTQEATRVIEKIHPDIILCDVMMRGTTGISFAKKMKSDHRTAYIPLILLSAKHEVAEQVEGINAGAELYITKPFDVNYLKSSVNRLINQREALKSYFSSPISAFELTDGKLTHKDDNKLIKDILQIIDDDICNQDLSAGLIAEKLNMSTRSLYRKVGEISDRSIADMIRNCRLHVAEDLLIKSKLTTDEIIFRSGFSNRVSFFKAFSKKNGCTPREFRGNNKL